MNILRLELLSYLSLVLGVFFPISTSNTVTLLGSAIVASVKIHRIFIKIIVFFIIGSLRGNFIEYKETFFTSKTTSFEAKISQVKKREESTFLTLEKIKPITIKTRLFLDEKPQLPKQGIVKVKDPDFPENVTKGSYIKAIGRFFVPMPSIIYEHESNSLAIGYANEIKLISLEKPDVQERLILTIEKSLEKEQAEIANAIFLCQTHGISKETRNVFQEAGLAHLLGVSVLNVAIFDTIIYFLSKYIIGFFFANISRYISLNIVARIISLTFVFAYCYIINFEYPLQRSFIMSILGIIALYSGRKKNLEALLIAASGIILINPDSIFDLSFQLSFAAVLGLCSSPELPKIRNKILKLLARSAHATFWASCGMLPISIYHFNNANIQPFISNMIAIPYVSFIMTPISSLWALFYSIGTVGKESWISRILNTSISGLIAIANITKSISWNINIEPIHHNSIIFLMLCLIIFAIIKERIRYVFLISGYSIFFSYFFQRPKKPFLILSTQNIIIIDKDKMISFPKCPKNIFKLENIYHLTCEKAQKNEVFQEPCGKKIISYNNKKIGLILWDSKKSCKVKTDKDYIIPMDSLSKKAKIISLN